MATNNYITSVDSALIDAANRENAQAAADITKALSKASTYSAKLKAVKAQAVKYQKNPNILSAAVNWLKANNANVLDDKGQPFTDGFYTDILIGDKKLSAANSTTLDTARKNYATDYVNSVVDPNSTLGTAQKAATISTLIEGNTVTPYDPTSFNKVVTTTASSAPYTPGSYKTLDDFKAVYGGLKDPTTGKPVFSDADLTAVFNAKTLGEVLPFNTKLTDLANQVVEKQQGSSYVSSNSTAANTAKKLASDPTKLLDSINALSINAPITNKSNGSTTTGGNTGTGIGQIPILKTWHAPQQGIATANSPYSGLLDAMLNKVTGAPFGTPETNKTYDALTSALTQGIGVNSLPKPQVTYNATNSAGITGLGIDYTGRTLTPLNTQVTSLPSYNQNQIANAKTAADALAKQQADALAKQQADALAKQQEAIKILSKYNFNNYISPETRAAIAAGTLSPKDPNLAEKIEYSKLLDSRAGNTGNTMTGASLEKASAVAENYNPIKGGGNTATNTTPYTTPSNLTAAQQYWAQNGTAADQAAIAQIIRQDQLNAIDRANNLAAQQASANTGNGIATNTGNFTSADNMNTNATGTNGASSIVSLLPNNPAIFSLSNAPEPVVNNPAVFSLSNAPEPVVNNPAVLNISNAQQQPVNNTPNYATGLTVNTSPINASPVNNPAVLNISNAPANDYGQYKDIKAALAGGMTQEQISAVDRDRNMRAMGLIP